LLKNHLLFDSGAKVNCLLCQAKPESFAVAQDRKTYLRCRQCGLVYMHPDQFPSKDAELSRYCEHKNSLDSPEYLAYLKRLVDPVLAAAGGMAKTALDFGCGPVEGMKELLSSRGVAVSSYDPLFFPSAALLKNSYDFVLCSEAAEHFFSPAKEFDLISCLVRPGGVLGVSSQLYPANPEEFVRWGYRRDPTHVCFFSEATVQWIADRWQWAVLNLKSPIWILRKL
jgi:hypothetical protein